MLFMSAIAAPPLASLMTSVTAVSLQIHLAALFFVAVVHERQFGDKAWTSQRVRAFRRTAACFMTVWAMLEAVVWLEFGKLYAEPKDILTTLGEATVFLLIEDALFYWSHRTLHTNKWAFRHIHLLHHESQRDVSLVNGLQMTYSELMISIVLPGMLPLMLVPFQSTCFRIYSFVSLFGVVCDHGLDVFPAALTPFPLNGVHGHILHHERLMGNYSGPLSVWDYLMGTNMRPKPCPAPASAAPPPAPADASAKAYAPREGCAAVSSHAATPELAATLA